MATITELLDGTKRLDYSTKETAEFIRQALKRAFPSVKFSVTTSYGSMTSSTRVRWTDGPTTAEVDAVTDGFTSRTFDGMTDSTNYHSQERDGMRVQYSGWICTSRELSPVLLRKAIARYQIQRAQYGQAPARIDVNDRGYVDGPDVNAPNPCGGRAMWVSDAIHQIAWKLRPNGCLVTLKGQPT